MHRYCVAFWNYTGSGAPTPVVQTCMKMGNKNCEKEQCVARFVQPSTVGPRDWKVYMCCCNESLCNQDAPIFLNDTSEADPGEPVSDSGWPALLVVPVVLSSLLLILTVVLATLFLYRRHRHQQLQRKKLLRAGGGLEQDALLVENGDVAESSPALRPVDVAHLRFGPIVGRGRYGEVYRCHLHETEVAVKVFPAWYRSRFIAERDIYALRCIEHANLVRALGFAERTTDTGVDFLLVLSFAAQGTVHDYLREHVLSFSDLHRMACSSVAGLSHLHSSAKLSGLTKPAVAHRDINSRNILVQADGTCCICDLGFAMKITGGRYFSDGSEQSAEMSSLTDVGTLRYMAPEVLEGAVNLRECETALKQVDVYAMALVLWELYSRCTDMYSDGVPPEYQLPYQAELGSHPSFEQVQTLVARNRERPKFGDDGAGDADKSLKSVVQRQLRETIEDSWDQDGEARLTASCVLERMVELNITWQRYKCGSVDIGPSESHMLIDNFSSSTAESLLSPSPDQHMNALNLQASMQRNMLSDSVACDNQRSVEIQPLLCMNRQEVSRPAKVLNSTLDSTH